MWGQPQSPCLCLLQAEPGGLHPYQKNSIFLLLFCLNCFQFTESYRDPLKFTSENRSSKTAITSEASIIRGVFLLNESEAGLPSEAVTADWQVTALSIHPLPLGPRTLEGSFLKAAGCTGPPSAAKDGISQVPRESTHSGLVMHC